MSEKRVLMLTTSYPLFNGRETGKGSFVHAMARAYLASGYQVTVLTDSPDSTARCGTFDGIEIHRFRYFFPGLESLTSGAGIPANIRKISGMIQVVPYFVFQFLHGWILTLRKKPDFIHAHWAFPTGFIGWAIRCVTGRPLAVTCYGAELFPAVRGKMGALKPVLKWVIRKADFVGAISEYTRRIAGDIAGTDRVALLPDGIDVEFFSPGPRDEEILRKYGLAGGRSLFFSGRMVERKGHRFVLEAMAELRKDFPDLRFLLGGDGPDRESLLEKRKALGLESCVVMPGFLPKEEIVPLLRSVDGYVLPSCVDIYGDTEGSATAAFEAMACGTPAILSEVGGNLKAVREGEGAFYFQPADPKDLARAVRRLFGEPKKTFGEKARSYVVKNYLWRRTVQGYLGGIGKS